MDAQLATQNADRRTETQNANRTWVQVAHLEYSLMWGIVGALCGSYGFLASYDQEKDIFTLWFFLTFFGIITVYVVGYKVRNWPLMRERRGWWGNAIGNLVVTVVSVTVTSVHSNGKEAVRAYGLIAVSVYALLEILKPIADYGLMQFFMRLPLDMAIARSKHLGVAHFATAAGLLVGTIWQCYCLSLFAAAYEAKLEAERMRNRRSGRTSDSPQEQQATVRNEEMHGSVIQHNDPKIL